MNPRAGTLLLVLLTIGCLAFVWGRGFLEARESPAFVLPEVVEIRVELGPGFSDPGIHQFFDDSTLETVIEMTHPGKAVPLQKDISVLRDGERLDILLSDGNIVEIRRGWMFAGKRMALGIPLDLQRMSREDWEVLPGIGPALADRIEQDRQTNGDFESLGALERVKGIGPKRIRALQDFFNDP